MLHNQDLYQAIGKAILNNHSVIDKHGRYKLLGEIVRSGSGYTPAELEGNSLQQYMHPEDWPVFMAQLHDLQAGETHVLKPFRFRLKNGTYAWAESSATNLVNDPYVQGYLLNSRNITDIVEAANARNKVTISYSNFFAKHPFGVVHMTMDGHVDMINPKLTEDLGYTLNHIQHRRLNSFFLPPYRRKVFSMFYKARQFGEPETFDVQVYKLNGDALHVNLTIVPVVYEGETIEVYAVVKDISDRHELQESLRKISIVADKTTNGVVIADCNGVIEWVNNGFTQINGYTLQEAVGQRTGALLKTDSSFEVRQQRIDQLGQGIPFTKEMLCCKKDGTSYWNLVEITPVLNSSLQLERMISIHTDITERKRAEQELQQFAHDLYKRNKELQQFGYIVSHNLRSPVANIMGIANLLEMDKDDPELVVACTRNLTQAIHSLDNVVGDLNRILSAMDTSAELMEEHVDLAELLEQIEKDLHEVIRYSGAEIVLPRQSYTIYSHKAYLYSVFYNLISNAIKYRSEFKPRIQFDILSHDDEVVITVADNGIGIDLNRYKNDIFKPYKRFNMHIDGKGLGLFLVKSHVDALNGTIDVQSEPEKGTVFTIKLPVNIPVALN